MSTQAGPPRKPSFERVFLIAVAVVALAFFAIMIFLPAVSSGPVPPRTLCKNNLKQIALAFQNYHDAYGCFPPAYIADKHGRPMHSWRVLILPFVEFKRLYEDYRFDEPWDGPHNQELAGLNLNLFRCPADESPESETNYLAVVGPKTAFPRDKCVRIAEITAGTILIVEVAHSGIKWSESRDLTFVEAVRGINPRSEAGISSHHKDGAQCAFADGSVRFLPNDTPPAALQSWLERNAVKAPLPPY